MNSISKKFFRLKLFIFALILLGIILRFYGINREYTAVLDSYSQIAGAIELLRWGTYSYDYMAPLGPAIILAPFLLISGTELMAQFAIALFGTFLIATSYLLMKYVNPTEPTTALVFAALVAINPMFIILSRVSLFENFLLLFFSIALLMTFICIKQPSIRNTIAVCTLFFILMLIKTPSILMLLIALIFLVIAQGGTSIKKFIIGFSRKNILAGITLTLTLFVIYLLALPVEREKFLTAARGTFSIIGLGMNVLPSFYILSSPLNTPATSIYFKINFYHLNIDWFNLIVAPFQILLLRGGMKCYSSTSKFYSKFLSTTSLIMFLFYCAYVDWQARYMVGVIYLELFYISIAVAHELKKLEIHNYKRTATVAFLIIITASLGIGLYHTISAVQAWNSDWSRMDNCVYIFREDASKILEAANTNNVTLIVTSYAAWLRFYIYTNENYSDIKILDLYAYGVKYSIDDESLQQLVHIIKEEISLGGKAWYVVGWPEIDNYNPNLGKGFQAFYYEGIARYFTLEELMVGRETVRNKIQATRNPSFYVFAILKDTEPTSLHNFVENLPSLIIGRTIPELGLNGSQKSYIHINSSKNQNILITGSISGDSNITIKRPDSEQIILEATVKKGEDFQVELSMVSGYEYTIIIDPLHEEEVKYEMFFALTQ